MGVLYDYFRAADNEAVDKLMEITGGGSLLSCHDGQEPVDGVETKSIDPVVVLGKLVAFARDVPWTADLVTARSVWPAGAPYDHEGPWVEQLDDGTRDALADIPDGQLPSLAAEWGQIEELSYGDDLPPDAMLPLLTDLVAFARRAQAAGDHVYCWSCL